MKITNVKEKSGSRTTDYLLLVEDENGWKPSSNVDFIQAGLDPYKRYWWQLSKTDKTPAVLDVTIEQAKGLLDKGYDFDFVEDSIMKITNVKDTKNRILVEVSEGWSPDGSVKGELREFEVEKFLDPDKNYWFSSIINSERKPAIIELTLKNARSLKSRGYTFDIVKEDEEVNEGPKFYALSGSYGLVMGLPTEFGNGFRAGEVVSKEIESGAGYLIFTSLDSAQRVANLSRKTSDFEKLQVVEVDPIAKKIIKEVEEPKPTKWYIAWPKYQGTPKWFSGTLDDWNLEDTKLFARSFGSLEQAEAFVKGIGLRNMYITEDK